jgi:lysophospholipase L1-like esterase
LPALLLIVLLIAPAAARTAPPSRLQASVRPVSVDDSFVTTGAQMFEMPVVRVTLETGRAEQRSRAPTVDYNPDPRRFEKDIQAFEAEDQAAPPPPGSVLFVGSSSIRYWDLDAAFPGRHAIKRGFGGSHVSDNLFYADRIIVPYRPSLIVFYAGDADVAAGKTAEQIGADYRALVALLHQRLPAARIVIVGTKPSPAHWPHMKTIRAANAAARSLAAADPLVEYADAEAALLGADGQPQAALFAENGLNLTRRGYEAWTRALRPAIEPLWPAR